MLYFLAGHLQVLLLLLQSLELRAQREELQMTREELKGQKAEFKEQNKTLKQQRFENTFFEMLSLHNEIISTITSGDDNSGRTVFKIFASRINNQIAQVKPEDISSYKELVESKYLLIYENTQSSLGHYFRFLYRIVKFVDESDIKDKDIYVKMVRAQLSNQELQLLFYNCLTGQGEKFKPLIEKYELFDNLPAEVISYFEHLMKEYDAQAFGGEYPL